MSPAMLIRQARLDAGLTQLQLAERLGSSQPEVARLERAGANPTVRTLERVLRATGHRLQARAIRPVPLDEAQLARNLALTPAQRLAHFQAGQRQLASLVTGARRVG
jgi:transcriptional regulator with XRE-family HTH domain